MGKSIVALSLSLVLAAALFTGCWGSSSSSSSSITQPPVSSSMPGTSGSMGNSGMDNSGMVNSGMDNSGMVNSGMDNSGMTNSNSGSTSMNGSSAAAPAAATVSAWQLRIVNGKNPLPEDFSVATVPIAGYENRLFDARAAKELQAMLQAAEAAGCKLYLVSAYRSVERQAALYRRKTQSFVSEGFTQEEAEKQAAMWVARPGTSEHNLGLAADIVSVDWYKTNSDLTEAFEKTPHFAWLQANAAEYGFILRYPRGKEAITGVTYEPWHYRYVGKEAAKKIAASGKTLEETCGA